MIVHPIEPVYDKTSRVLILGSFPSVKSREQGFFSVIPRIDSGRCWRHCLRRRVPLDRAKANRSLCRA